MTFSVTTAIKATNFLSALKVAVSPRLQAKYAGVVSKADTVQCSALSVC